MNITQTVAFSHLGEADWAGDIKHVYSAAYALTIGIFDITTAQFHQGCSLTSIATRNATALNIKYTALTPPAYGLAALQLASESTTPEMRALIYSTGQALGYNYLYVPSTSQASMSLPVMRSLLQRTVKLAHLNTGQWAPALMIVYTEAYVRALMDPAEQAALEEAGDYFVESDVGDSAGGLMVNFTINTNPAQEALFGYLRSTAFLGTDGDARTNATLGVCTVTAWGPDPWWRVDLQQQVQVSCMRHNPNPTPKQQVQAALKRLCRLV